MSEIEISVIIPFFNPGEKLKKAIDSVFVGNPNGIELILWNDGSDDNFDYQSWCYPYSSIVYKKDSNQGVGNARNQGAKLAKGKFLLFLDADDWLEPGALDEFLKLTKQFSDLDMVFSWSRIYDLRTGLTEEWKKYHQMIFSGRSIAYSNLAGTFLLRKEIFNRIGGYNPKLRFSENLDLMIRILSLGDLNIKYLESITVNFGNSLEGVIRNGKFSQSILLQSLSEFYISNQVFFLENPGFAQNVVCRIIVASIFLKEPSTLKIYLKELKRIKSPRYPKFFILSQIPFLYRKYLFYKGFRP